MRRAACDRAKRASTVRGALPSPMTASAAVKDAQEMQDGGVNQRAWFTPPGMFDVGELRRTARLCKSASEKTSEMRNLTRLCNSCSGVIAATERLLGVGNGCALSYRRSSNYRAAETIAWA